MRKIVLKSPLGLTVGLINNLRFSAIPCFEHSLRRRMSIRYDIDLASLWLIHRSEKMGSWSAGDSRTAAAPQPPHFRFMWVAYLNLP